MSYCNYDTCFIIIKGINDHYIIIPPAKEVAGVYSDPYVRPSVRPSPQSLIRYSSKTAEQNFMKLSGIFTTWCRTAPPILSFYSNDFGVSQSKTRTLPYKTWGSGGIILWAMLTVFLVFFNLFCTFFKYVRENIRLYIFFYRKYSYKLNQVA